MRTKNSNLLNLSWNKPFFLNLQDLLFFLDKKDIKKILIFN